MGDTAWQSAGPLPSNLNGLKCITLDNVPYVLGNLVLRLYTILSPVLGGKTPAKTDILKWNGDSQKWEKVADMLEPRYFFGVSEINLNCF